VIFEEIKFDDQKISVLLWEFKLVSNCVCQKRVQFCCLIKCKTFSEFLLLLTPSTFSMKLYHPFSHLQAGGQPIKLSSQIYRYSIHLCESGQYMEIHSWKKEFNSWNTEKKKQNLVQTVIVHVKKKDKIFLLLVQQQQIQGWGKEMVRTIYIFLVFHISSRAFLFSFLEFFAVLIEKDLVNKFI